MSSRSSRLAVAAVVAVALLGSLLFVLTSNDRKTAPTQTRTGPTYTVNGDAVYKVVRVPGIGKCVIVVAADQNNGVAVWCK